MRAVSASHPIVVNETDRFGIEDFQFLPENAGGTTDTQAGSHPFQITTVVTLNTEQPDQEGHPRTVGLPKNVPAELPAGFVGNPTPFEQCTDAQFGKNILGEGTRVINECPAQSAVGMAAVSYSIPSNKSAAHLEFSAVPIFNMVPRYGEPARFAFKAEGVVAAYLDPSVRSGGDYGLTVASTNTSEATWLLSAKLTFWGVPGDSSHDGQRGWECLQGFGTCLPSTATNPPPFLRMPTSCGPFQATLQADSWASFGSPSQQAEPATYTLPDAIDGCNRLAFGPAIKAEPTADSATTGTGLDFDLDVKDEGLTNPERPTLPPRSRRRSSPCPKG